MTTQTVQTVYSKPNHLQWYHVVVIAAEVVLAAFGMSALYFLLHAAKSSGNVSAHDSKNLINLVAINFGLGSLLYYSAFSMLRNQRIIEYDSKSILFFCLRGTFFNKEIPFSNVAQVLRRSDSCLSFTFKSPLVPDGVVYDGTAKAAAKLPPNTLVSEAEVEVNETDAENFCKTLSVYGVSVTKDPIPDDDPRKQNAIGIVVMVLVLAFILGGIWFAMAASKSI